jgi:DNA-binding PadR family transcriptional regulator
VTADQRILRLLAAADREIYGLDLVAARVAGRSGLYVTLHRMEVRGWIASRFEDGPEPRRRLYRITDAGRAAVVPVLPVATLRRS